MYTGFACNSGSLYRSQRKHMDHVICIKSNSVVMDPSVEILAEARFVGVLRLF